MKKFLLLSSVFSVLTYSAAMAQEAPKNGAEGQPKTDAPAAANDNKTDIKVTLSDAERKEKTLELLEIFGDVFEKVRKDYVEEKADKKLVESAINGMLTSLDPHSSFLNEEDFKEMQEQTKGEFGGLGIEVTLKNGLVYVVAPIDDTPAFKAGLKAGDYISHIDGNAVFGLSIGDAVKKMRGKPGEAIELKIIREGEKKPLDLKIIRDIIKIKSVKGKVYKDVGYVRVSSFTDNAGKAMVEEIKKQIVTMGGIDKVKGFVLDLRNNPGGLLNEAIAISDAFLNQGEIVSTKGRQTEDSQKYSATAGDVVNGLPLVVLINGGSASASEIVSGALKDHRRAVILGEKSFGKGSVQTVIPLTGNTAIRLTTSRYYTPSGKSIQAEGIEPDIEIKQGKLSVDDTSNLTKEAELSGHLENDNAGKESDDLKNLLKSAKNKDGKEQSIEDEIAELNEKDYQLARALDMVKAIFLYNKK